MHQKQFQHKHHGTAGDGHLKQTGSEPCSGDAHYQRGCTGNGAAASGAAAPNSTGATPLKEFISFESGNRELESWNMLYTQKAEDANVVTNLWDGLLSFDCYGKVVPAGSPGCRAARRKGCRRRPRSTCPR